MIELFMVLGLTLIAGSLIVIILVASNNSHPTFMHCREMRAKCGTPKKRADSGR